MERKDTKVKTSMRNFLLALVLLLITNSLMGITLMKMSKNTIRNQVEDRMLDVSKAAAAQIDGDVIKNLTAEDKETDDYIRVLNILRSFQDNIELDYIYGIKPGPDDTFTFAIDPDRDDPADFGRLLRQQRPSNLRQKEHLLLIKSRTLMNGEDFIQPTLRFLIPQKKL